MYEVIIDFGVSTGRMVRNIHTLYTHTRAVEMISSLKILEVSFLRFYFVNTWVSGNENHCDNCYVSFPCFDDMSSTR